MNMRAVKGAVSAVAVVLVFSAAVVTSDAQTITKEGSNWVSEIEKSFQVSSGGSLEMSKIIGDVSVETWTKNEVFILEKRMMDVSSKKDAEEAVKRDTFDYNKSGNTVTVSGKNFESRMRRLSISFEVKVPENFDVEIGTAGGDVSLEKLNGEVGITTAGGDIEVAEISGPVKLKTAGGDIKIDTVRGELTASTAGGDIIAENIDEEASLSTSGGDIEMTNIGGTVKASTAGGDITLMESDGSVTLSTSGGDIEIEKVGGTVVAKTSGGDIEVRESEGDVSASTSGGDIALIAIGGPVEARTAGGDIQSEDVDGGVKVKTAGGDIDLVDIRGFIEATTAGGDLSGEITLKDFSLDHHVTMKTAGGDVMLYIPADMPATVHAVLKITKRARDKYSTSTDFSLSSKTEKGNGWGSDIEKVIITEGDINGGGDLIEIETTNGNIQIRKR